MIPFSSETYVRLIAQYNDAIWPLQIVAGLLGLVAVLLALWPRPGGDRAIAAILAALWIWTGLVFHILSFAAINWGAWLFGLLFVVQGLLFALAGVLRNKLRFRFHANAAGCFGLGCVLIAVAGYPLVALAAGQELTSLRSFAVTPAPLTLFTLGLLLLSEAPRPRHLLIIPLLWCAIAGAIAWGLAIPEDLILPIVGFAALGVALWPKPRRAQDNGA